MGSVFIDNSVFRHRLSPDGLKEAFAAVGIARAKAAKLDSQLAKALPGSYAANEAMQAILQNPASILTSAIRANKKLKARRRETLDKCLALPNILDLTTPITELVRVRTRIKKDGSVGAIHNFGLMHRTAQDLIARIVSRQFKPRPFQYGLRGTHCAISDVKKYVQAGYLYAARLDIQDFYGSFDLKKLAPELPLPHEVVEHAVVGRHIKAEMDQGTWKGSTHPSHSLLSTDLVALARRGLPPGSASAPVVAEFIVAKIGWAYPDQVVILNYCDDWLILTKELALLTPAINALTDAVSKLPGGHFKLKLFEFRNAHSGINFLGHRVREVNGSLNTTPLPAAIQSLEAQSGELDLKLSKAIWHPGNKPDLDTCLALLAEMRAVHRGWRAAFRECDDIERQTSWMLDIIEEYMLKLDVTPHQLDDIIDESMGYRLSDYALG